VVLQDFVTKSAELTVKLQVVRLVGSDETEVPPVELVVEPDAVATSDSEVAELEEVSDHVPVSPPPKVAVLMFGELAVLLTTLTVCVVVPLITSLTVTLYSVPTPVLVTKPLTGKVAEVPPEFRNAVPQLFVMLRPQTGKLPAKKSFRTALVD
jgi:hypothetical protein